MLKIIDYKEINKGALVAQFTVQIDFKNMLLRKCKLFKKENDRWISLPAEPYEKDGQKKFYNLVAFERPEDYKDFCALILEKLDGFGMGNTQVSEIPF